MNLTYKRKGKSSKGSSFYDRICSSSTAECTPITIPNGAHSSNASVSMENEKVQCDTCFDNSLSSKSLCLQSQSCQGVEVPPVKFTYARRDKREGSNCNNLSYTLAPQILQDPREGELQMKSVQPDSVKDCHTSCQSKFCLAGLSAIPDQEIGVLSGSAASVKESDIGSQSLILLETSGCLWRKDNHKLESLDPDKCNGQSLSTEIVDKEENICSNLSTETDSPSNCKGTSMLHVSDITGSGEGSYTHHDEPLETKRAAPLLTYCRQSKKKEQTRKTYIELLAERNNDVASQQSFPGNTGDYMHEIASLKDLTISETDLEHSLSDSQSLNKMVDGESAAIAIGCRQETQMVPVGGQLMDDPSVSEISSFNDGVMTGQKPVDEVLPLRNFFDISSHAASQDALEEGSMLDSFRDAVERTPNSSSDHGLAVAASKQCLSDVPSLERSDTLVFNTDKSRKLDDDLAASTVCKEAIAVQPEPLQHSVDVNHAVSLIEEVLTASSREPMETMNENSIGCHGMLEDHEHPSQDAAISKNTEKLDPISLPNDSTNCKVLQLFPEETTDRIPPCNIPNSSGLFPAVTSSNSSVMMALPDISIGCPAFIQNNVDKPSCSQARRKLLLDSIRCLNRSQMNTVKGTPHNLQPSLSLWLDEELDSLWVGVRRHGKDNWNAMLNDPRLRFSTWRTARDLSGRWMKEQTKLLGETTNRQVQHAMPVGVPIDSFRSCVPPSPGFMTRFLTDPTQLSLGDAYSKNQGTFLPRSRHNFFNGPGNGDRPVNLQVRSHRRSKYSENIWGRFKARDQPMQHPQFPSPLASSSRNEIPPYWLKQAFDNPLPGPPQLTPASPVPYPGVSHQFHDGFINKRFCGLASSSLQLAGTGADGPRYAFPGILPRSEAVRTKAIGPHEVINVESDASSEGTISDSDNLPSPVSKI